MDDENNVIVTDESGESTEMSTMEDLLSETGNGDLDLSGTNGTPYDEDLDAPIIGKQYLATFQDLVNYEDLYEERTSSVVSGIHFNTEREMQVWLDKGYQKITVEEQDALVAGGVRRKSDGAIVDRPPVITPLDQKINRLLELVDHFTADSITGGFEFEVTSTPVTGKAVFDSSKEDQMTFSTMFAASQSPDFPDHPTYHGRIPMRGRAVSEMGIIADEKTVYYLDAENMLGFESALAEHIGQCKINGWQLQALAKSATDETYDEIEAQIYAAIGYDPEVNPY